MFVAVICDIFSNKKGTSQCQKYGQCICSCLICANPRQTYYVLNIYRALFLEILFVLGFFVQNSLNSEAVWKRDLAFVTLLLFS